jgi:tripartite-type tricarboxylate transporter receptor subunit TctC
VELVNRDVRRILALPDIQARMAEQGIVARGSTPAQLAQLIDEDTKRWAQVIKDANLKGD